MQFEACFNRFVLDFYCILVNIRRIVGFRLDFIRLPEFRLNLQNRAAELLLILRQFLKADSQSLIFARILNFVRIVVAEKEPAAAFFLGCFPITVG